jgi:hypothetical protein
LRLRHHRKGVKSLADDAQLVVDVDTPRDGQALCHEHSRVLGVPVEVTDAEIEQTSGDGLAVSYATGEGQALVVESHRPLFVRLVGEMAREMLATHGADVVERIGELQDFAAAQGKEEGELAPSSTTNSS